MCVTLFFRHTSCWIWVVAERLKSDPTACTGSAIGLLFNFPLSTHDMFSFRFFLLCFIIIHGITAASSSSSSSSSLSISYSFSSSGKTGYGKSGKSGYGKGGKKGSKGKKSSSSYSSSSSEGKNKACFFTEPNFQGKRTCFSFGQGDFCEEENGGCGGPFNDKIRSIGIGKNVKRVQLFQHGSFIGPLGAIKESTKELPPQYHDFTSFSVEN